MNGWVYLSPTLPTAQFFAASISSTLIVPCNVLFLLYHGYLFFSLCRKIILLYFCVVCFCFQKFPSEMEVSGISRVDGKNLFYFLSIDDGSHRELLFAALWQESFPIKSGREKAKLGRYERAQNGERILRFSIPFSAAVSTSRFCL